LSIENFEFTIEMRDLEGYFHLIFPVRFNVDRPVYRFNHFRLPMLTIKFARVPFAVLIRIIQYPYLVIAGQKKVFGKCFTCKWERCNYFTVLYKLQYRVFREVKFTESDRQLTVVGIFKRFKSDRIASQQLLIQGVYCKVFFKNEMIELVFFPGIIQCR